ncbi:TPA: DUF6630 family protein [Serratia fonticola]
MYDLFDQCQSKKQAMSSVKTPEFLTPMEKAFMDEDIEYNVVWDEEEAEFLNELAVVILKDKYSLWPDLLAKISKDPAGFESEEVDTYGIFEIIEDEGGELRNGNLMEIFLRVLSGEDLTAYVDWKCEDEEGQLARFTAERVRSLTKNEDLATALEVQLLHSTKYDEIDKACEEGNRYLDEIFERVQLALNEQGFEIANLNTGTDSYNVFVATIEDYERVANIDNSLLTVQNFLS